MSERMKPAADVNQESGAAFLDALKQEHIDSDERRTPLFEALGLNPPKNSDALEAEIDAIQKLAANPLMSEREKAVLLDFIKRKQEAIKQLRIIENIERGDNSES